MLATGVGFATAAEAATQVGFKAHSYSGFGAESSGGAITGEKPESKLWFHDGQWWGAMVSPTNAGAHTIWRLGQSSWTNTGVVIDTRPATKEDVLSLGPTLYATSRASSSLGGNKLRRFTYGAGGYQLDAGFPVNLPGSGEETLTLARDSIGRLWVTYESGGRIFVAHSTTSDTVWSAPFQLPVTGASGTSSDDISSIIAFTDNAGPAVGVMWSNQSVSSDFFAVHRDNAPTSSWTVETALSGTDEADDHINIKTSGGRVYAVVKTEASSSSASRIRLLVRSESGSWARHHVATVAEANTRPIMMLFIDPVQNLIYVFMTIGEGDAAEAISYKVTSTNNIVFPGQATVFIRGPNAEKINNATSTKQNGNAESGIVVLASDGANYWWNRIGGGGPPVNTPPTANPTSVATAQGTPVAATLTATDPDNCELSFSIVQQPAHGSLGPLGAQACTAGSPNTDRAGVTYTPAAGFSGADSFTFRANDGTANSNTATVSVTVGAPPGGIVFRSSSSAAKAPSTSLTIPAPAGLAADDVLVAVIDVRGNPTLAAPAGWTLVRLDGSGVVMRQAIYIRVAGSSVPPSFTWTLSSLQAAAGGITAYGGVDTANPVMAHTGQISSTGRTNQIVGPSITTIADGAMILGFFGVAKNTSVAPPAGMTERFDVAINAGGKSVVSSCADALQAVAGATGNKTAISGAKGWNIGQLLALRRRVA
ncbi:MAG: Ig-like domain-containing protein [Actinomycetota bacterium]